ncbi:MAG: hypothetical protein Q4F57_05020 [Weeksellaceae bacterium]|nr:hypothetical protein [Weeksellaceae bacterium]
MKSHYQFDSAQELSTQIIESIKMAYGNKPIKITIESDEYSTHQPVTAAGIRQPAKSSKSPIPPEIAEAVLDFVVEKMFSKGKK